MTPRLVLLNGGPGLGKSTLARRWAAAHPLGLALDLDVLRSMLGGWADQPSEAGLLTRAMALAAARVHLVGGRDVVVPQYVGRIAFVRSLAALAAAVDARFVEILLVGDPDEAWARFGGVTDPLRAAAAATLAAAGGAVELRRIDAQLRALAAERPATVLIPSVEGRLDEAYAALEAAI